MPTNPLAPTARKEAAPSSFESLELKELLLPPVNQEDCVCELLETLLADAPKANADAARQAVIEFAYAAADARQEPWGGAIIHPQARKAA